MRLLQSRKKLDCLLKSLPQNYSHIGVLVDVLPEKERTVDYLKSKIKLKSIEGKSNEASNDSSNVFQTETRSVSQKNCFNCGKPVHLQRNCTRSRGHGYSGYRSRGNHTNEQPRNFHHEQYGNSFHTIIANNITSGKEKTKRQIESLLDSGCTDHIVNIDNCILTHVRL